MLDRGDPRAPRELAPGSVVLGRYTIQKVLGRGGMATVYLARHQQTERLVALKLLDQEISRDPSYVERFRREARAAGRVRSEYTVAIYDLDAEVGGGLVLVMEYLEGQTVQQALRAGRMPIAKVLSFGRHMLEGLAAAHEVGVIHRDLKPANLFIERSSTASEKCKILDFGISKLADASQSELTRDGQTLGTVAYMAPEQIRGKAAPGDGRVDLYSAGVTLFVMLTGKRPIDADDPVQLLAAVLENPPLTLAQATGVPFPAQLEQFIAKALAKTPNDRFQTSLEMRDALIAVGHSLGHDSTGPLVLPSGPGPTAMQPSGSFDAVAAGQLSGVVPTASKSGTPSAAQRRATLGGTGVLRAPTPPPLPGLHQPPPVAFAARAASSSAGTGPVPDTSGPSPAFGNSPFAMPPSPTVAAPMDATGAVPGRKQGNGMVLALGAIGVIALGAAVAVILIRMRTPPPATAVIAVARPRPTAQIVAPVAPSASPATPVVAPPVQAVAPVPGTPAPAVVGPEPTVVAPAPPVVPPPAVAAVIAPVPVAPPVPVPVVVPAPAPVAVAIQPTSGSNPGHPSTAGTATVSNGSVARASTATQHGTEPPASARTADHGTASAGIATRPATPTSRRRPARSQGVVEVAPF